MSRRWYGSVALAAALSLAIACSDDPAGPVPQPGTLTLRLTTPHTDDGAMTFEVSGPVNHAAAANASLRLFTRRTGVSTTVGAVIGPLANGAVVTLHVPDVSAVEQYSAAVREVADRENALRASLAGYALSLTR